MLLVLVLAVDDLEGVRIQRNAVVGHEGDVVVLTYVDFDDFRSSCGRVRNV